MNNSFSPQQTSRTGNLDSYLISTKQTKFDGGLYAD